MNYIQEINAFNEWLITNPSVSPNDIVLWYALMSINNSCGWKKEFNVAISTIVDRTRLSRSAIYRSRNRLVQLGRISVNERKGNLSTNYQMLSFVSPTETHNGTQTPAVSLTDTQCGTQPGTQSGTQTGTIPKLKETKLKKDRGSSGAIAPSPPKSFKQWDEKEFIDQIAQFKDQYPYELRNNFFKYWKERTAAGQMRFQTNKTWETALRLETWAKKENNFTNGTHLKTPVGRNGKSEGAGEMLNSIAADLGLNGRGPENH